MTGNEHFYLDWQFLIYSTLVLGWLFWRKNYQFRLKRETKYPERTSRSNWWFVPLLPNEIWCYIFSYLDEKSLKTIASICKLFFEIVRGNEKLSGCIILKSVPLNDLAIKIKNSEWI